jgi:hypothetical protein
VEQAPPTAPPYYAPPPAPTYPVAPAPYEPPTLPYDVPPGPAPVPLLLEGNDADLRMVLSLDEHEPPFVRCRGRCAMALVPGRYTLTVGATREVSQKSETLEIDEPSRVMVKQQAGRQHPLALAGFITVLSGGALIAYAAATEERASESSSMGAGLIAILAGIVMIPIGAGLSTDAHVEVRVEPL